jgi:hypothetical protein
MQSQKRKLLLTQKVLDSYEKNMSSLSNGKQFHFNSRMFLWTRKAYYKKKVSALEKTLLDNLDEVMESAKNPTAEYPKKFLAQRKKAIEKYPWITRYNTLLFKWLFLKTIFKKNIRKKVLATISEETLRKCVRMLLNDPLSLTMLSTLGINFLYLTRGILQERELFSPRELFNIATENYANTENHAELKLYFFTHCIIGESQFYKRRIRNDVKTYIAMIRASEETLEEHFDSIPIDNKVEFLVTTKLCQIKSVFFNRIQEECEKNFSEDVGFIREPRRPMEKQTLSDAEHRNVLYTMSNLRFSASKV